MGSDMVVEYLWTDFSSLLFLPSSLLFWLFRLFFPTLRLLRGSTADDIARCAWGAFSPVAPLPLPLLKHAMTLVGLRESSISFDSLLLGSFHFANFSFFSSIPIQPPCLSVLSLSYSFALGPLHPASSATISAHRSPIANTVSIGFALVISGNTPASAILTPFSPLTRNLQSTTAISSPARSPIFVVPAG